MKRKAVKRVGANRRQVQLQQRKGRVAAVRNHGPRVARKILVALAIVALVLGALWGGRRAISALSQVEALAVKEVVVTGNVMTPAAAAGDIVKPLVGTVLNAAAEKGVSAALLANPWVEKVKLHRGWGGKLKVIISERTPVALVQCGRVYQMDRSGVLLDLTPSVNKELVLYTGLRDTVGANGIRRLKAADLALYQDFNYQVRKAGAQWTGLLAQVHFADANTIKLTVKGYPVGVVMGRAALTERLGHLQQLLQNAALAGSQKRRQINLRYQNLAYVE